MAFHFYVASSTLISFFLRVPSGVYTPGATIRITPATYSILSLLPSIKKMASRGGYRRDTITSKQVGNYEGQNEFGGSKEK